VKSRPETRTPDRAARWVAWLVAGVALLLGPGCKDTTCRGEIVDGQCQEVCVDSHCGSGSLCVDNRCEERCKNDGDCDQGTCVERRADNGKRASFCEPSPAQQDDDSSPVAAECRKNRDCDASRAEHCIDGACRVTCLLHSHCGPAGTCSDSATDDEGQSVLLCAPDDFPRGPGEYGTRCPAGNSDCSADFRCVGAGEGDSDAYCTALGCDLDDDCPVGMYCSYNRTTSPPCEPACNLTADASDPSCVPADAIGDGQAFRCGDGQLELHLCLQREYCNDCETDADCRSLPGQICARGGDGSKSCTTLCDPGTNSCLWGSASSCQVWDEKLGEPTCGHKAGSCHGTGDSCEPCVDDRDCPRGFCSLNSFTSEQFCVDETATCSCAEGASSCVGGGCPETPGGLAMNCVPRSSDAPPDACFGAPTVAGDDTSALGCWPQ
jgi:hypothetical protein